MSPGEIDGLVADLLLDSRAHAQNDLSQLQKFEELVAYFCQEWRKLWSIYGQEERGFRDYRNLITSMYKTNIELVLESNQQPALRVFNTRILVAALNEHLYRKNNR